MTDFSPTELERTLETRTQAFIRDVVIPYEKDPRRDSHGPTDELRAELIARGREAGLIAPHLPKHLGGLGLTHREQATVFRAAGYSMLGPLAMNIQAPDEGNMHLIDKVGTPMQQERFLKPLARGDVRSAFLMTEPDGGAGADPSMLATVARREAGGGWRIDGRKWLITGAVGAKVGIVMARTGEKTSTMFLIDMDTPGLTVERVPHTMDGSMPGGHATLKLDNVRVPDDQVLGAPDEGFAYAQVRLAPARLTHCMRWWGAAQRAHHIATAYANNRKAFGKNLIDHEGVGFMLADNELDLLQSRLLIDHTAWVLDQGHKGTLESSMAKVAVSEALFRIADRCVQVMGGSGIVEDTPVSQIFREIRAFRIYDGPSEVHRWSIARRLRTAPPAKA